MASKPSIILTDRDLATLDALNKTPLDAQQLLDISVAFPQSFPSVRVVRRRLQALDQAGFASTFHYWTNSRGVVNYYKLTPLGFQMIHGFQSKLPSRSFFGEVSLALQEHTRALADFIVRTHVSAHSSGIRIDGFYRENELKLTIGEQNMKPDCAFQLIAPGGRTYNYVVELDCGTEPIRSTKQRESLEQKIRFYDRYQDTTEKRFRVLVVFTKSPHRMSSFLLAVGDLLRNPQRTLFCATCLPEFMQEHDSIIHPLFRDHRWQRRALVPRSQRNETKPSQRQRANSRLLLMTHAASVW